MNDFIKNLVNYVIEAKIKDYRGDQSAEVYRLSRINREISPSDAPADKGSKFAKINADYKEEKRLERAPRGPQTRPVVKKPMEEGYRELKDIAQKFGGEVVQTGRDVKDAIVGGERLPKEALKAEPKKKYAVRVPADVVDKERYLNNRGIYTKEKAKPRATSATTNPKSTPSTNSNDKYHIGPPIKEGIVDAASRGIEAVDNALGNPLTRGIRKQGEKDRAKLKDMMDNKGAKGKITREPANPFSKGDWQSRKERMDKAIDG